MKPLVQDMVQAVPERRPAMDQVVKRFDKIRSSLSSRKLRSRVSPPDEVLVARLWRSIPHWLRQIEHIRRGLPAIPNIDSVRAYLCPVHRSLTVHACQFFFDYAYVNLIRCYYHAVILLDTTFPSIHVRTRNI
jgi:hypothetical protein